jgi:hypothetical protein
MNQGKYVFSQVMAFASHNDFIACVTRYKGDHKTIDFTCWKQFLCMAFGQLTHRESLSDTILCLSANKEKLYHLGIGRSISKSTLSKLTRTEIGASTLILPEGLFNRLNTCMGMTACWKCQ